MLPRRREAKPRERSRGPLEPQHDNVHPLSPSNEDHNLAPPSDDYFHRRRETNPHFLRPLYPPLPADHSQPPPASVVPPFDHLPPYDDGHRLHPISPHVPHIGKEDHRPDQPSRPQRVKAKERPPAPSKDQSAPKPPVAVQPDAQPIQEKRGQRLPQLQKTRAHTWFAAVFCVIFWLIIIIGGLIVLIVYLVFRPQSPHFDVSSVTLNAAYLDLGYLLNADVTVLANFTNPNKKVHVHFSSMIIDLYYGSTLIATQYVEPFSAAKATSRFAAIHMVSSQVRLPLKESQRLVKQMETNGVLLEVKGIFRATSKLGSILTYSYNLYGLCNIMVTRPPDGVMIKRKCRTKR